jgi:hypothetical protein
MTLLTSHTNGSVIDYGKRAPRAHAAPRMIHVLVSHSPFALASAHGRARAELTELMPGFYIGSEMERGKGGSQTPLVDMYAVPELRNVRTLSLTVRFTSKFKYPDTLVAEKKHQWPSPRESAPQKQCNCSRGHAAWTTEKTSRHHGP